MPEDKLYELALNKDEDEKEEQEEPSKEDEEEPSNGNEEEHNKDNPKGGNGQGARNDSARPHPSQILSNGGQDIGQGNGYEEDDYDEQSFDEEEPTEDESSQDELGQDGQDDSQVEEDEQDLNKHKILSKMPIVGKYFSKTKEERQQARKDKKEAKEVAKKEFIELYAARNAKMPNRFQIWMSINIPFLRNRNKALYESLGEYEEIDLNEENEYNGIKVGEEFKSKDSKVVGYRSEDAVRVDSDLMDRAVKERKEMSDEEYQTMSSAKAKHRAFAKQYEQHAAKTAPKSRQSEEKETVYSNSMLDMNRLDNIVKEKFSDRDG